MSIKLDMYRNARRNTARKAKAAIAVGFVVGFSMGSAAAAEYSLNIGTVETGSGSNTLGWRVFEQYVEANSDGQIEVEIHHSSALGDTEELLEGIITGTHRMAQGDSTITGAYDPMMPWLTPYLFRDEASMKQFFESETFSELSEQMAEDLGVRVLAGTPYGFYSFINAKQPIETLEDLDGMRLRTLPGSELTVESWEALGASPTPTPWPEIVSVHSGPLFPVRAV